MLSDIFNLQEKKNEKKRLSKIIVILLAVLMLAAMLPVSAIAESYSAARDLRILNKAHQEVEKDLLAVDSEQYKAGKAPEETVAELIGMLENDPRIASVKRDSATTFTYKLHSGLTAVYDCNIIHGHPQDKLPEPSSLEQMLPMKQPIKPHIRNQTSHTKSRIRVKPGCGFSIHAEIQPKEMLSSASICCFFGQFIQFFVSEIECNVD
mgnify:CR=1 FL=1